MGINQKPHMICCMRVQYTKIPFITHSWYHVCGLSQGHLSTWYGLTVMRVPLTNI
jgi:hypothetical protein